MDNKQYTKRKQHKKNNKRKDYKSDTPQSEQTYRFRRVLGEILKYLKSIPHATSFEKCQKEYEAQLTELIHKGFTWGYQYPIPVHDSDFKALQKKEWAAIRAIVRKQEYTGPNPEY